MDKYRLDNILKDVNDEKTFINFLSELHQEWLLVLEIENNTPSPKHAPMTLGWENGDLSSFLEAAVAGGEDKLKDTDKVFNNNSWQRAAFIIYHGKFYE